MSRKAFNATPQSTMLLTEGSRINENVIAKVAGVATDISGGSFKLNLVDKEGGTIIDSMSVTYSTDGTDGAFDIVYEIAELAAVIAAYDADETLKPQFWEFFFSSDGTAAEYKIWSRGPIDIDRSGGA